jgi:sucrose phosphorylase
MKPSTPPMQNKVQLITYVDRLSGGGFKQLRSLLDGPLAGVFGGVHLLPFFDPIDGADAGFDPVDHTQVDARLGNWDDVAALAERMDVMADVIVNHVSSESPQFLDYSRRGAESPWNGLFLTLDRVFPDGAREQDLLRIYRPRPGLPLRHTVLESGERRILWSTFTAQQLDIDVTHPTGRDYLDGILRRLAQSGVRMVRLDAVGYAIKKAGGTCFMMPETFAFIDEFSARARALGMQVLVEVHSHYAKQIEIAERVDWVYDFALPPLLLHAFAFRTAAALRHWIEIRPNNALTVLDTHDGIGIIDIGADATDREARPGLVPPDELDRLVERIHDNSGGESRLATGAAASNLDLYQINCTFHAALGHDDLAYLLARAVQFFLPGIAQVYYVGLFAGANDMALLEATGVGRDINRHHYAPGEIDGQMRRPVVRELLRLIRLRNETPAFDGYFRSLPSADTQLTLEWRNGADLARLEVDFRTLDYRLQTVTSGVSGTFRFDLAEGRTDADRPLAPPDPGH